MTDHPANHGASAAQLEAALREYFEAPGSFQLTLRQPASLFSSVRDVLQIAAGNFGDRGPPTKDPALREAAAFFIRAAFLYPGADHYALFGLPALTEPVELKDRYRLLMRLIHPDFTATSGSTWPADAAVRVNRAYEVLSSPVLRLEYDEQLANPAKQRPQPPARVEPVPRVPARGENASKRLNWKAVWILGSCGGVLLLLILVPRQEPMQLVQNRNAAAAGIVSLSATDAIVRPPPPASVAPVAPVAPEVPVASAAGSAPTISLAPAASMTSVPAPHRTAPAQQQPKLTADSAGIETAPPVRPAVQPPAVEPATRVLPAPPRVVQSAQPRIDPPSAVEAAAAPKPEPSTPPEGQATPPSPPPAPVVARQRDVLPPAPEPAAQHPTLNDAQPLLSQLLHLMESGSGDQMLRLLDADARKAPAAQALSRQYEQVVRGGRPVRLTQVEFRSEGREGVLLVIGRIRLHAGEPTIGSHGERLSVRAEFVNRGGRILMTGLSGGIRLSFEPDMPVQQGAAARALAAAVVALCLLWGAVSAHLRQACVALDTPYLPLCEDPSSALDATPEQVRARISENPGDSAAWSRLLVLQGLPADDAVLDAASVLAPNNVNVLRWRAARALERGQAAEGLGLLVNLLRHRSNLEAAQILAGAVAAGDALPLLRPHLVDANRWLPAVLGAMASLKLPLGQAMPLVAEALAKGELSQQARRDYMRSLKAAGQWFDAYGLWLTQHKKLVPLLYNGSFDHPIEADGFDWEIPVVVRSRTGVLFAQPAAARRGNVLEMEFTGRRLLAPLVVQHVFAPPGTYRLRGEYMATNFRSEAGLVWNVRCVATQKEVLAQSAPLLESGGLWKPFELMVVIPEACGVARIQLDPAAGLEAAAGLKGRVGFDNMSLARAPS